MEWILSIREGSLQRHRHGLVRSLQEFHIRQNPLRGGVLLWERNGLLEALEISPRNGWTAEEIEIFWKAKEELIRDLQIKRGVRPRGRREVLAPPPSSFGFAQPNGHGREHAESDIYGRPDVPGANLTAAVIYGNPKASLRKLDTHSVLRDAPSLPTTPTDDNADEGVQAMRVGKGERDSMSKRPLVQPPPKKKKKKGGAGKGKKDSDSSDDDMWERGDGPSSTQGMGNGRMNLKDMDAYSTKGGPEWEIWKLQDDENEDDDDLYGVGEPTDRGEEEKKEEELSYFYVTPGKGNEYR